MQKLEKILKKNIKALGAISVREFMNIALYHPDYGYYIKKDIIGKSGDFITAPEVSQVFGELIANWILVNYNSLINGNFNYLELGPGKGTLCKDILRTIKKMDSNIFKKLEKIYFLEKAKYFKLNLKKNFKNCLFIEDIAAIGSKSLIVLANEFFDALPVNQYIKKNSKWYKRIICLDNSDNFMFTLAKNPVLNELSFPKKAKNGDIFEYSEYSDLLITQICKKINKNNGALIIIDYAKTNEDLNGAITAIFKHKIVDLFYKPGLTDISVKPDFDFYKEIAIKENCKIIGPIKQGFFLQKLGINERISQLIKYNPNLEESLYKQKKRLTSIKEMGDLFKVLIITNKKFSNIIF